MPVIPESPNATQTPPVDQGENLPSNPRRDFLRLVKGAVVGAAGVEVAHRLAGDPEKIQLEKQLRDKEALLVASQSNVNTLSLEFQRLFGKYQTALEHDKLTEDRRLEFNKTKRDILLVHWEEALRDAVMKRGGEWNVTKGMDETRGSFSRVRVEDVLAALESAFPWEGKTKNSTIMDLKARLMTSITEEPSGIKTDANDQVVLKREVLVLIKSGTGNSFSYLEDAMQWFYTEDAGKYLASYPGKLELRMYDVGYPGLDQQVGTGADKKRYYFGVPIIGSILWDKPQGDGKLTKGKLVVLSPAAVPDELKPYISPSNSLGS